MWTHTVKRKVCLSLWSGKGLLPSSQLPILNSEAAKPSAGWKKSKGAVANSRKASSGNRLSLSSLQPGGHPRGGKLPDKDSSRAWPGRPWPASLTDTWTPCRMWAPGIVQSKARANREKGRNPEADLSRGSLKSAGCPAWLTQSRPWPDPLPSHPASLPTLTPREPRLCLRMDEG